VRLQLAGGGSPFTIAKDIVAKDGFLKLYTGLSAGVLRQITYTSSRLGIFKCAAAAASRHAPAPRARTRRSAAAAARRGAREMPLRWRLRSAVPLHRLRHAARVLTRAARARAARCPRS
jgi:hypothetical protein